MNYLEAVRKGREFIEHCTEILQSFGYQDIQIKIPYYTRCDKPQPGIEITRIEMYFWYGHFGYSLTSYQSEDINTDRFFSECNEMLNLFSDPRTLKEVSIEEELLQYLEFHAFNVTFISSTFTNEKSAQMVAYKGNTKYQFNLWRRNAIDDASVPFEEEDECTDLTDEEVKAIDRLKNTFGKLLQKNLQKVGWEIEICPDFQKIVITKRYPKGLVIFREILSYGNNLLDEEVENAFYEIIHSIMDEEPNYRMLEDNYFHIHKNSQDKKSFFAYKEGERYEVRFGTEKAFSSTATLDKGDVPQNTIDFDHMEGHDFERFCAKVLSLNGFENVNVTQGSGDQGIDIIAFKDGIKYGFQCKCYASAIGNKAVQETFAGKAFYECHLGVVLTNQYFTRSAKELAQKNGIILWDRKKLIELIKKSKL